MPVTLRYSHFLTDNLRLRSGSIDDSEFGSSVDWKLGEGEAGEIPIEERDGSEVSQVRGLGPDGRMTSVRITREGSRIANFGFDVTPARLVTGLITERGVCPASRKGLASLFPDKAIGEDARE